MRQCRLPKPDGTYNCKRISNHSDRHNRLDKGEIRTGMDGDDVLCSNARNDSLHGYEGDDRLVGGRGDDLMWGDLGAGEFADTYVFHDGNGNDTIADFDVDEDVIRFRGDGTLDGFDDLTFTEITTDPDRPWRSFTSTLVTWGDGENSIFIQNPFFGRADISPHDLSADDFIVG